MTFPAESMMSETHVLLSQQEIESLNDHEYSLFLAYGDTFRDQQTIPIREGSDLVWEGEATRLIEQAGRGELCFS